MGVKRKQHSAQFKAQVAMAALSGEKTLAELAAEYGIHPTMISTWKQELVKRAGELFERGAKTAADRGCVKTWKFGFSFKNFPPQVYLSARRNTQSPPAN